MTDRRRHWIELLELGSKRLARAEARWPRAAPWSPSDADRAAIEELASRLGDNFPFFHPRYAGQMLKPPHPVAWAAYALAASQNPNNHARDGGPATADLEVEAVAELATMLGLASPYLGHLTSGGTIANLEALWVASQLDPGRAIAVSSQAHYTHARAAELLGIRLDTVACDQRGQMDIGALSEVLDGGDVGTVVATLGTTGLGALDPVHEIVRICGQRDVRVHVDAAYGGFFTLLARRQPPLVEVEPFAAVGAADSVVIDPHKHGLQPYGCGCVIFADPSVSRFYGHDSPYTYFTSGGHLGEIALECSRAGAAAAALWATLRAVPLEPEVGLGDSLAAGRRAAVGFAGAIEDSDELRLVLEPETDIVLFAPVATSASAVSAASERLFEAASSDDGDPVFLAQMRLSTTWLVQRWPDLECDADDTVVLRSVLMKPEHEAEQSAIAARLCELAREL